MPLGIGGESFIFSSCLALAASPAQTSLKLSPTIPRSFDVSGMVPPSLLADLHNEIAVKALLIKSRNHPGWPERLHPLEHRRRLRIPLVVNLIGTHPI